MFLASSANSANYQFYLFILPLQQNLISLATSEVKIKMRGKMQCCTVSLLVTHIPPGHGVKWTEHPTRYMHVPCIYMDMYTVYKNVKTEKP